MSSCFGSHTCLGPRRHGSVTARSVSSRCDGGADSRPKPSSVRPTPAPFKIPTASRLRDTKECPESTHLQDCGGLGVPWRDPSRRAIPAEHIIVQSFARRPYFTNMSALSNDVQAIYRNLALVMRKLSAKRKEAFLFALFPKTTVCVCGSLLDWGSRQRSQMGGQLVLQ